MFRNVLRVSGDKHLILAFVEEAVGFDRCYEKSEIEYAALVSLYQTNIPSNTQSVFCFHKLKPVPKKVLRKGFEKAGYDWEIRKWSCICGAINPKITKKPSGKSYDNWSVEYEFVTINSPPVALIKTLKRKNKGLRFKHLFFEEKSDN